MKAKKIFALLLAVVMVLGTMAVPAFATTEADVSWYDDTKTEFEISTEAQLMGLAKLVNEGTAFYYLEDGFGNNDNNKKWSAMTIKLTDNIDLSGMEWTPIGVDNRFLGIFDGAGKTISNLTISSGDYVGLFGLTGQAHGDARGTADIKNFTLDDISVTGGSRVAGVVAEGGADGTTITNVSLTGKVNIIGRVRVGGILGSGYSSVNNCSVIADENSNSKIEGTSGFVGGIVGWIGEGPYMSVTSNTVKNIIVTGGACVGGIMGVAQYNNVVSGCHAENVAISSTTEDDDRVGLIFGTATVGTNAQGEITATVKVAGNTVNEVTATDASGNEVTALYGSDFSTNAPTYVEVIGLNGDGSETNPWIISSVSDLGYFRDQVNAGTTYSGQYVSLASNLDLAGINWTPIGLDGDSTGFAGTFDGGNHTISNLTVSDEGIPFNAAGLFGSVRGTIKNLTVDGATVSNFVENNATVDGTAVIAGCTGYGATIDNVHVKNATVTSNRLVGAISGYAAGSFTNCTVENVTLTAIPNDEDGDGLYDNGDKVGVLIGYTNSPATVIENCTVSGTNTVTGYRDIGGLVGCISAATTVEENEVTGNLNLVITQDAYPYEEEGKLGYASTTVGRNNSGTVADTNDIEEVTAAIIVDDEEVVAGVTDLNGTGYYTSVSEALAVAKAKSGAALDLLGGTLELTNTLFVNNELIIKNGTVNITGTMTGNSGEQQFGIAVRKDLILENVTLNANGVVTSGGKSLFYLYGGDMILAGSEVNVTDFTYNAVFDSTEGGNTVVLEAIYDNEGNLVKKSVVNVTGGRQAMLNLAIDATDSEINVSNTTEHSLRNVTGTLNASTIKVTGSNENGIKNTNDKTLTLNNASKLLVEDSKVADILLGSTNDKIVTADTASVIQGSIEYEEVSADAAIAEKVTVKFELVDGTDNEYNVFVVPTVDGEIIYEFGSAELKLALLDKEDDKLGYEIEAANGIAVSGVAGVEDAYFFNMNASLDGDNEEMLVTSGTKIQLAKIILDGYGKYELKIDEAYANNVVNTAVQNTHLKKTYKWDSADSANSTLVLPVTTGEQERLEKRSTINVTIDFSEAIQTTNAAAYNAMTVKLTGSNGEEHFGYVGAGTAANSKEQYVQVVTDAETGKVSATFAFDVTAGYTYTAKVTAPGYRTVTYTTQTPCAADGVKNLYFWNDWRRATDESPLAFIETDAEGEAVSAKELTNTFLAGDIVADDDMNIYDLSAVVAYAGMKDLTADATKYQYAKYDLDRDGRIDSEDIDIVLNAWRGQQLAE